MCCAISCASRSYVYIYNLTRAAGFDTAACRGGGDVVFSYPPVFSPLFGTHRNSAFQGLLSGEEEHPCPNKDTLSSVPLYTPRFLPPLPPRPLPDCVGPIARLTSLTGVEGRQIDKNEKGRDCRREHAARTVIGTLCCSTSCTGDAARTRGLPRGSVMFDNTLSWQGAETSKNHGLTIRTHGNETHRHTIHGAHNSARVRTQTDIGGAEALKTILSSSPPLPFTPARACAGGSRAASIWMRARGPTRG